jgi:hypothetical protein
MDSDHFSRVKYDMPQEQLNYFDSRARSSQSPAPSSNTRVASENREVPRHRVVTASAPQRVSQSRHDDDDDEPKLGAQRGSLSYQYQQFFAAQPCDAGAVRSNTMESAQRGPRPQRSADEERPAVTNSSASQRPAARQTPQEQAQPSYTMAAPRNVAARSPYQPTAIPPRRGAGAANTTQTQGAADDGFYWSHNEPSAASQRLVEKEPRERTLPTTNATHENRIRVVNEEELPSTPQNDYEQPRGDRQAPLRKSSVPRSTPMSRDARHHRSESAASVDGDEEAEQVQRAYIPRNVDAIPPVRQPAAQQQQQQQQRVRPQYCRSKGPALKQKDEEAEKLRDDEENCTFHPQINYSSRRRSSNFHESPYRSSQGTNPPRDSRGDYDQAPYDRLYNDAEIARRASESRRTQKNAGDAELEINEKYGPRTTAINPRRSAVERDTNQEEVFARLYADAQRYNREKSEQERLLELKRQEERGEGPFDWHKGKVQKSGATEEIAMSGDESSAPKARRSPSRQKPLKNMEVFERLARPTSVTLSYQKQKELEEQEKKEKEQRELEQKKTEMEKIAGYNWGIPAKSFTFADLESQNAMYVS